MESDTAAPRQPVVTQNAPTPWKTIAIVFAEVLVAALISLALIVSSVMKLGLSLV